MKKLSIFISVSLLGLVLSACSQSPSPQAPSVPIPTQTSTRVSPTNTSQPVPTETLLPTSTAVEMGVADYCIECHTDKDQLILTAKEEEVVESESEGVG